MIDALFFLAVGALGWGLSLTTYRPIARHNRWPMGALQVDFPALPVALGIVALVPALIFAMTRGDAVDSWVIVLFGVLLAVFWTGFLRVGSQSSLLLAPVATVLLVMVWLAKPLT